MFGPLSELTSRLDWLRDEMEPSFYPPLNVWEDGELLKIEAEVPGVKLEDIDVSFNNGELTLKGEKKVETKENAPLHRRERLAGSFVRSLTIPWEVAADRVTAELKDGILTVTLPKAEAAKPHKVAVKYVDKK
ncbi:MAG TPA: Hsp20/alpha crystallin family protein [Planctomycetota bacterium]|jgi:HSP20 family protein|nr:Hsp20/alpha crystallin family protein [Planctomycetota bacterium]